MAHQIEEQPSLFLKSSPGEKRTENRALFTSERLREDLERISRAHRISINNLVIRTLENAVLTGLVAEVAAALTPREPGGAPTRILITKSLQTSVEEAASKPEPRDASRRPRFLFNTIAVLALERARAMGLLDQAGAEASRARRKAPSPGRPRENRDVHAA